MVLPRWLRGSIGVMMDGANFKVAAWHVTAYASFGDEAAPPLLLPDRLAARSTPRGDNRTSYSTRRYRTSRARRSSSHGILGRILAAALERQASGVPSIPFSLPRPSRPDAPPATRAGRNSRPIHGKVRLKHTLALKTYAWWRDSHTHVNPSPWED